MEYYGIAAGDRAYSRDLPEMSGAEMSGPTEGYRTWVLTPRCYGSSGRDSLILHFKVFRW